jgi:hypothetical protein
MSMKKTDTRGLSLMGRVIFIFLVIIFFAAMLFFVIRAGTQASVIEQVYAKQIALTIDNAKPGMEINLDISELYEVAEKNEFKGNVVTINNDEKSVMVTLASGRGYKFDFFNDVNVVWSLDKDKEQLYMEIK